ncbi:hypothetical protein DMP23_05880 [Amycolatopsis sp. A1MSW2902]|uniref:YdeI/OmpD-associated family protein n=1 Tax=Amycolatopsis TaxID=1813 RepID=UPI00106FEC67|nr:hypothetical protein [Amycolatopsis nivea]
MTIFADAAAWRNWLAEHHDSATEVWVVLAKKGEPGLTYEQALREALCYGWIDGLTRRRDDSTYTQRYTPRRPKSPWSPRNLARAELLRQEGRMRPAGQLALDRAAIPA